MNSYILNEILKSSFKTQNIRFCRVYRLFRSNINFNVSRYIQTITKTTPPQLITDNDIGKHLPLTFSLIQRLASINSNFLVSYYDKTNKIGISVTNKGSSQENVKLENSLVARCFTDSYAELVIPFQSDQRLRDIFRRPDDYSTMRWGLLLEICDALAGDVAYRHSLPEGVYHEGSDTTMVTLSIDGMHFFQTKHQMPNQSLETEHGNYNRSNEKFDQDYKNSNFELSNPISRSIKVDKDLKLKAFTTYVGKTSLEVRLEIIQDLEYIGAGFFVMVALDKSSGKPKQAIPALVRHPQLRVNDKIIEEGPSRLIIRKEIQQRNSLSQTPMPYQMKFLHNRIEQYQNSINFRELQKIHNNQQTQIQFSSVNSTLLKSTLLMQHDKRNVHNKIFGGYIARKAFELSWMTTQLFISNRYPVLKAIDQIFFFLPVEVGDMIEMSSKVIFSTDDEIQVEVEAAQINPVTKSRKITNSLTFTYEKFPYQDCIDYEVVPLDYSDCIKFMTGFRRYLQRAQ